MPYGIHFVSQQENPVGFLTWRVASLAQDASEFSGEVRASADAVNDLAHQRVAFEDLISSPKTAHAANDDAQHILASELSVPDKAQALVLQAQQLAEGKDAHDADTIAKLQLVVTAAEQLSGRAQGDSDQAFNDLTSHTRI